METLWKSVIELSGKPRLVNSLIPTAIFLVGLGALVIDAELGWQNTIQWWQALKAETQLILAVVSILLVMAVAAPFDSFTPMFLRWAEGYWEDNPLLRWLDQWRRTYHRRIIQESQAQFSTLRDKQDEGVLSPSEALRAHQLDILLHSYPSNPERAMPTLIGNIIRAAEDHARVRYGLDPIVTWVRVYPSISRTIQEAMETNQTTLDLTMRIIAQTICFTIIGILFMIILGKWLMTLLVLGVGWAIAYLAYQAAIQTAKSYAELIRAVFDLYRFDLYQSLHLPLPTQNGDAERKQGDALTRLLWRGDVVVRYEHRKEIKDGSHSTES